jgi:hypothetical protein
VELQPGYYVVRLRDNPDHPMYIIDNRRPCPLEEVVAGPLTPEQVVAALGCGKLLEAALELFGGDSEAQEPGTDAYTWRYLAQDALAAYDAAGKAQP